MSKHIALLKTKISGHIYLTDDVMNYENLTNGGSGKIPDTMVKSSMIIPLKLNQMAMKNPNLIKLIRIAGLAIEQNT